MADTSSSSARPDNRRQFFRQGLSQLLRPLAGYVEERLNLPEPRIRLRPPGALDEQTFRETCLRCGNCMDVCPADAIRLHPGPDDAMVGTPVINASLAACVVCDDLACTKACPSGALVPLDRPEQIHMGLALVDHRVCVRSKGEECRECVDRCPIGESAITIDKKGRIRVSDAACVGCGVCEQFCPTKPKAIVVDPI